MSKANKRVQLNSHPPALKDYPRGGRRKERQIMNKRQKKKMLKRKKEYKNRVSQEVNGTNVNIQLNTEYIARILKAMTQVFERMAESMRNISEAWKKVSIPHLKISEDAKKENCVITAEILSKRRKRNERRKKNCW